MKLPNVPMEEYAPAKLETSTPHSWFNRYGGYIIETRWNPVKKTYDEIPAQSNGVHSPFTLRCRKFAIIPPNNVKNAGLNCRHHDDLSISAKCKCRAEPKCESKCKCESKYKYATFPPQDFNWLDPLLRHECFAADCGSKC